MPRLSKLILVGAALGLLLLASLIVTSLTVELRGVRDRVIAEVSARLPGAEVSIGELHLSFLPLPHVVLERVSLSLPDVVRLEAQLASVYPRILPLLSGNLRLSRIRLSGLEASLRSPARQTDSATGPAPRSSPLTGLSAVVASQSPGITLIVDGARLAMTPPDESGAIWLESAEGVHLRVRATDEGDGALLVQVDADVSSLTLRRADARLALGGGRLRATLGTRGEHVALEVSELGLEAPALEISGAMSVDPDQHHASLQGEGRDLEIAPILAAAEFLSDGADPVRVVADVLRGGVVPELSVHAEGNDMGDLARLEAFLIRGRLQDGLVHVRAGAVDLDETSGDVVIKDGVLSASNVAARLGRSSLAGGSLQLGLAGAGQIQLESREARLALDEIHARATSTGWLPESWWSEARIAGTANLSHVSVGGPLNAPEAWRVSLEGAIQGFEVDSASWSDDAKLRMPLSVPEMRLLRENGRTSVSGRAAISGAEGEFDIVSTGGRFEVSRLRLRDAHSDATLRFSPGKDELEVGFLGKLRKKTLDALLVRNPLLAGSVEGDFQARLLPAKPLRSTAKGRLKATDLTVPGLARVHVEKLSLKADATRLNFDADADAPAMGKANLVGAIEFRGGGLVADATLRGGDVDLGALLEAVGSEENDAAKKEPDTASPWRGFLRAKVNLELDSLRYGRSHWKPFRADVELVPEGPVLTVRQARTCQITTDGAAAFAPSGVDIDVSLTAKDEAIEQLVSCLLGREDALTGTYDLEAQIRGEGESSELVRSLRGTVRLESRRGQIKNVPLIARTLAAISIATGSLGNLLGVQREGLPYDRISLRGDLRKGELYLEEYVLEGPSVKMTGQGSVTLADGKLDLTLIVAPLRAVDFAVGKVPLVGDILGGSLVSIPVAVRGEIGDPTVTPMDPSAVGAGLKRLAERTLSLPARALRPLLPGKRSK